MKRKRIYIFRYHGRNAKILGELINNIAKKYRGKFISIEDQSEISFFFPIFNFISWKTPKKFIVMELEKIPEIYCENCNLPISLENTYIETTNIKQVKCKSCGLSLIIKDKDGIVRERRLCGDNKSNKEINNLFNVFMQRTFKGG